MNGGKGVKVTDAIDPGAEGASVAALEERIVQIGERRATLERRLDEGLTRIDRATMEGHDVARWEAFWLDLLHEYEGVCDELAHAA